MALAGVASAFNDAIWTFEDNLNSETGTGLRSVTAVAYGKGGTNKTGGNFTSTTATYSASGMTVGTKVGNYYLDADLGKSITLSGGNYILVSDKYWANSDGKIGSVAQMLPDNGNYSGSDWSEDTVNKYKNSYTLMAWVKFDNVATKDEQGNVTKAASSAIFGTGVDTQGVAFNLIDGDDLNLCTKGVSDHRTDGSLTLSANTWYNVAVTYDCNTDKANYYLNGVLVGTKTVDNFRYAQDDSFAAIGAGSTTGKDALSGSIAEFKILSGALDQAGILKAAHLTTVPEPTTATLSLLALAGLAARRRRK